ncbi:hypothetical protein NL532_00160 [Mesorhizobium sp. C120A]|nr:hypothetical protein NL532_00160 [Mesorhizobium sp. C120A]
MDLSEIVMWRALAAARAGKAKT